MTTPAAAQPPKLVRTVIDYILSKVMPVVEREVDELKAAALAEIEELKTDALKLITDELPKLAATISETAVREVFDHTNIDESVNKVTDVFDDILGRFFPTK